MAAHRVPHTRGRTILRRHLLSTRAPAREPRPSVKILKAIEEAYGERKDEVVRNAKELRGLLERSTEARGVGPVTKDGGEIVGSELLSHAFGFLASRYDSAHGGFGTAPKFPQPVTLEFALRVYARHR